MQSYDAVESKKSFSQIEKAVLRTKKEWEATFDAIPDMLILTNSDGRISRCNQATIKTFHSKYGDLVGHVFSEFFPEARGANGTGIDIQLFEERHWYRVYSIPVAIGADQKNHVYLFQDISKRKVYELEILKEEQYYEALFRANPDCMVVLGMDHNIRQINPAFEKAFGYTQIESKGLLLDQLLSPMESFQPIEDPISTEGDKPGARIWQCRKRDGSRAAYKYQELPVLLNGINHGWVATFHSYTPPVPAVQEPDLPANQKDDLIENLTGRLRSPLNSMLELIAMLEDIHLAPEQSQRVDAAKENASSLLELLIEVRNRKRRDTFNQKGNIPARIKGNQDEAGSSGIEANTSQKIDRNNLRILLVEDNPINQKLATRLLQKGGHLVRVADDGIAALRILSQQAFDIVLMDVQMPEMDGLEATRQIRMREPEGRHQIIVAMTAEGPGGEREKCFRAGMDAFIAKPLDIDQLFTLLDKYTAEKKSGKKLAASETRAQEVEPELLDIEVALPRFGGEIAVYFEFLARFIKQLKQTDQKLRTAYKKGDVEQLHSLSHGLKGTAANFEAITVRDSASALEELTANNTVVGAYALINDIANQIPLIEAFYHNHVLMEKKVQTPLPVDTRQAN